MVMEIGRLCVKIAGRDANKKCVIIDVLDKTYVMIDGETRRKKCNMAHLEPLKQKIDIEKGASHEKVKAKFKELGIDIIDAKPREAKPKPKKLRAKEKKPKVEKTKKELKKEKKAEKKAEKKETTQAPKTE